MYNVVREPARGGRPEIPPVNWNGHNLRGMMALKKTEFNKRISEKSKMADPDRIKYEREREKPLDAQKSPWDYRCPQYDQRSSNFVNAGTHYGVGINQPVGHEGNPKMRVDVLPYGRKSTMRDDEEG
jgi:hypothetical protein